MKRNTRTTAFRPDLKPKTCYFTDEEREIIHEIASLEERAAAKVVQLAVRAFGRLYDQNPDKALELARPGER